MIEMLDKILIFNGDRTKNNLEKLREGYILDRTHCYYYEIHMKIAVSTCTGRLYIVGMQQRWKERGEKKTEKARLE